MITCDTNCNLNCAFCEGPIVMFLSFLCGELSYSTSADKCMVFWGWFPHLKRKFHLVIIAVVWSSRSQVATPGYTTDFRREIWFLCDPLRKWRRKIVTAQVSAQVRSGLHVKCWVIYATKTGLTHNIIELYATGYHASKEKRKLNIL